MRGFLQAALDAATSAGATYADVRGVESTTESLSVTGPTVEALERSDSVGFGVRVIADGAWGHAASSVLDPSEAATVALRAVEIARASATAIERPVQLVPEPAHRAQWSSPVAIDPLEVPLETKVGILTGATAAMARVPGLHLARGALDVLKQTSWFLSSEGSDIEQTVTHTSAGIEATAVDGSDVQHRSYPASTRGHLGAAGFELVEELDLEGNAERTAEEAVALLSAPECPDVVTTLVLDGHQVMLQVHESVGHPTELDRVLGMEAAFAGTSFVGVPDVGSLRYGSDIVNITSDATVEGGIGTFAYDDEGVEAQRVDLVRDGVLVGFQSSRETAAATGNDRSNGTMRAEGWENFPLIRMTNINLLPGAGSFEDLLADVDRGIFMATNKSWSIDDKRKNFQF
ncbi:MAG: TldD/PmbA family protein, partial [Actinomycetota bacterium]